MEKNYSSIYFELGEVTQLGVDSYSNCFEIFQLSVKILYQFKKSGAKLGDFTLSRTQRAEKKVLIHNVIVV